MNFDILIPIKPYYAYLIMKGLKPVEVRKFNITDKNWSGKLKCYVSKDKTSLKRIPEADRAEFEKYIGKVAFEFTSRNIDELHEWELSPHGRYEEFEQKRLNEFLKDSCLTINEIWNYRQKLPYYKPLYGYRVTALKVYDKPKELGEFRTRLSDTDIRCKYRKKCSNLYSDKQKNLCTKINDGYKRECDFNRLGWQTDCSEYEPMGKERPITRPPQSWQYVGEVTE